MKKSLILAAFALSAFICAGAQQTTSPMTPGATARNPNMPQATTPGTADQSAPSATPQSDAAGPAASANVTEGCLGGTNPNFTVTDSKGKAYKLNLPAGADGSRLTAHVGESIQVMGNVNADSIDVTKVGRGNSTCNK